MAGRDGPRDEFIHETLLRITNHCERNAGRLTPEELEQLGDLLLKVCGDDPEYPCRADLERESHDIRSLEDPCDWFARGASSHPEPARQTTATMHALIARLLVAAQLPTRKQRLVARLHLWGCTLSETARMLDVPLTSVISRWRCAKRHLQRAMREIPPTEWMECFSSDECVISGQAQEAFREEQHRCLYRGPRHCPDGKERCRVTGICTSGYALDDGRS